MYYYITTHYFEANEQNDLYNNDTSKNHRMDPVVQMGLFVDKNGLPVSYDLASRNPGDIPTLSPTIKKRGKNFGTSKIILVGDNGINSANHLYYVLSSGNGYIVSQNVRGADKEIKDYVLNQEGYTPFGDESKIKSRIHTLKIRITTAYGAAKYVQNIEYDKMTGEILQGKEPLHLDKERLKEEEKYDGYYLFITSELDENVDDLINAYIGLWEIEKAFKYINNKYHAKPGFVSRVEHMQAHYLTCFVSLVITRILEMKIQKKYPLERVLQSLRRCNCVHIEGNNYLQSYYDSVLDLIGQSIGIDFSKRYGTLCNIRENIGITKKR